MVEEIKKTSSRSKKTSEVRSSSQALQKASVKRKPSAEQTKAKAIVPKPKKVKIRSDKKIKATEDNIQKKDDAGNLDNEVKKSPKPSYDKKRLVDLAEIHPTTKYIYQLKRKRTIIGLTAYDSIMAKLVSKAGVDFILVGDSVGTTMLGFDTTIPVTINDMVHHTAAVRRGMPGCLVVADLPFGEASLSFDRLLDSARRLMQCGADAVKIEGGKDIADDIEKLVATGIPVMGHIGLLPQTVKAIGGYRKFGTTREEADELYTDAISLEEAGCFAIIAEMMDEEIAAHLADQILPPLIGIGSGHQTDGEILVTHDLLGLTPSPLPSFVKPCASLGLDGLNALQDYVVNLRNRPVKKK